MFLGILSWFSNLLTGGEELKVKEHKKETRTGIYGAVAVAQTFKGADFPLSKQDIMQKYGDKEIEYHRGRKEKVQDILANIPDETFNSPVDLEHAFHEALENPPQATSGVYGAVAVAQTFKGADFPLSKQDIMQKYGDKEIEYHRGRKEKIQDVLAIIPDETFNSIVDLEQAFHQALEEKKE